MLFVFASCEKDSNYRFKGVEEGITAPEQYDTGAYPDDGSLAFHENFQSWKREGFVNLVKIDCEADQMTTSLVMYVPDKPKTVQYEGFTVNYMLKDFAVNPVCGNVAGSSEAASDVSTGYVALQQLIFYECGQHDSDGFMQLSALPSVSRIRFSVSLGGKTDDVAGVSLWKKADGDAAFVKVGDYLPTDTDGGEVFEADINAENVQLKFIPALTGRENPVNDGINRCIRIHDLWVWSGQPQ
ncbi:MAG: hypothetical protein LBR06_06235 [Bacteroidales bacterium]|nr:hypothetical protein [Bacteroidales bacterium]